MQMNEQVLTALEVLRNFAENDFELHRIDVLEKDLTDPPQVEIIDDTHQKFNGVIFHKNKEGHYENTFTVHRSIFIYYHGEIPNGYVIHHCNENKSDNDISNLQMLTSSQHKALHNFKPPTIRICPVCKKTFRLRFSTSNQIYCSIVCGRIAQTVEKVCPKCGKKIYIS